MLCVKPTDNLDFEKSVLNKIKVQSDMPRVLTAEENGNMLGYIAVDPIGTKLDIVDFSLTDCNDYDSLNANQKEIAEYLLRAAGNYAFNRNMLTLETKLVKYRKLLEQFRFTEMDNKFSLHLKVLFKKCENCAD